MLNLYLHLMIQTRKISNIYFVGNVLLKIQINIVINFHDVNSLTESISDEC